MKILISVLLCTLIFAFSCAQAVLADAMPIANGRFSGGPVTVLSLTNAQKKILTKPFEWSSEIILSADQRQKLLESAKLAESPTKLQVIKPEVASKDCTCGLANIGLWFAKDSIEVPHAFLCSDKEAEERKIVD